MSTNFVDLQTMTDGRNLTVIGINVPIDMRHTERDDACGPSKTEQVRRMALPALLAAFVIAAMPSRVASAQPGDGQCLSECKSECPTIDEDKVARGACVQQCTAKCTKRPPVILHPRYLIMAIVYAPPGC